MMGGDVAVVVGRRGERGRREATLQSPSRMIASTQSGRRVPRGVSPLRRPS